MMPRNAKLSRVTDAASEPLTVAEAKKYLRLEVDDDDDLIADLITAARLEVEAITNCSLITTTWKLTLDELPLGPLGSLFAGLVVADSGAIDLPMPPLIAVSSILYTGYDGASHTLDPSSYVVSPGTPGRVAPTYGNFFPFTLPQIAAASVTYTAGFGPDATTVPKNVKAAMRLLVSHYYEHRTSDEPVPRAVRSLLGPTIWGAYA